MHCSLILLILGSCLAAVHSSVLPADDTQALLKIYPRSDDHIQVVLSLKKMFRHLDFWSEPDRQLRPVVVAMPSESVEGVEKVLMIVGIKSERLPMDHQAIDPPAASKFSNIGLGGASMLVYYNYDQIVDYLKLMEKHYAGKAQFVEIGKTNEGRAIPLLIVSDGDASTKDVVMLECGIHAREWISTATCVYIANLLLKTKTDLLTRFEFHIVPVTNPDGYSYTWTKNRAWRKNRSPPPQNGVSLSRTYDNDCRGTDPNRNFETSFCSAGASNDPCDSTYCGQGPFSEPESRAIRDHVLDIKDRLKAYFALHAYGQYWMWPYGYTTDKPDNQAELARLASLAVNTIKEMHGKVFKQGNIATTIYPASGSSIDWVYSNTDCKITYAIELRDEGQEGFRISHRSIQPTAAEAWAGIQAVIRNM